MMEQIATDELYRGYLKPDGSINDNFFKRIANKNQSTTGYGSCFSCATEEEYYLYLVKLNWQKR